MASTSCQPNPRTKTYSSASEMSLTLLLFFIINFLFLHSFVRADPNPSLSHFSRFPRHPTRTTPEPAPEATTASSRTTHKGSFKNIPKQSFYTSVELSMKHALQARSLAFNLTLSYRTAHRILTIDPINDCRELLDDTLDMLSNVMKAKLKHNNHDDDHVHDNYDGYDGYDDDDVHTWLSAALTNQETCKQSLQEKSKFDKHEAAMDSVARHLSGLLTNSLDLFVSIKPKRPSSLAGVTLTRGGRKLLSENFPTWVSSSQRKLLEAPVEELRVHAVVSADGSGTHKSIGEALGLAASLAGGGRTVIHVKAGTYNENIKIPTKQKNVMLVGDGKGKTVILGDRSNKGGWTTYQTATVAAMGDGFIARDITFVNSAGPSKGQAVALLVGSDRSVVYRCSVIGYQDSLYTHSKRQFFRETDISGTVDFIFGNSAAVFQSCDILVRKPLSGQSNFVTAQGRINPNQNTGISIHNCKIAAAPDLAVSKTVTYLGRPWKEYSRTVVMQSFLDGLVHRSGWAPWSGNFALKTLFYGEYANSGPGSSISGRVKWAGYHPSLALTEAEKFTVATFIDGNIWLPSTGVSFDSGLLK